MKDFISLKNRFLYLLMATSCLAMCQTLLACDTPVFRYALEKWDAGDYRAYVFFRGELTFKEEGAGDSSPTRNGGRSDGVDGSL